MKIGIQNNELGTRGGINTYSMRVLRYLNQLEDVEASMFVNKCLDFEPDVVNIQYEPGMMRPNNLNSLLQSFSVPVILTGHHTLGLQPFYPMIDGVIIHDDSQITEENKPWDYKVIPHPALVYPKKDKKKIRKQLGLPLDKKIIGTMGFICGTGKTLPLSVEKILKEIKDDEFLYLITSFWKGGDMGRLKQVMDVVKSLGKQDNFRIDTNFMTDEDLLNSKMQACDLMYCWNNNAPSNTAQSGGSQSGSAADIYGARVKMLVKDVPHFSFIGKQDKVEVGSCDLDEFIKNLFYILRFGDLTDVQDPEWLSWETQIKEYKSYMEELL